MDGKYCKLREAAKLIKSHLEELEAKSLQTEENDLTQFQALYQVYYKIMEVIGYEM